MIEVPPPRSFEGRTLRYGAMTCGEYIWFRAKWSYFAAGGCLAIGIWELTLPGSFEWFFATILFLLVPVNLWTAFRWRHSWQFWRDALEWYLLRAELQSIMEAGE